MKPETTRLTTMLAAALVFSGCTDASAEVGYADLEPILGARCVMCHSGPSAPRGVRLDSLDGLLSGGDRGAIVIGGDPDGSPLIQRLTGDALPRMPMTGPPYLSDEEVTLFKDWVQAGMPKGESPTGLPDAEQAPAAAGEYVTFAEVAPIFAQRCAKCHTDDGLMGAPPEGYRLTTWDEVVSRVDRVRVVPGNPAASELLRRIRGQSLPRMPFDGPPYLNVDEANLVELWIADGARDAAGNPAPIPVGARVRFEGTLQQRWQVDGLPLNITRSTRVDDDIRIGGRVRVRGLIQEDGSIQVDRLQER